MTFEQFRASGRDVDDLGDVINGMDLEGKAGRVYGELFVEKVGGQWMLTLYGDQWLTDDLPALEARLFTFAVDDEWIDHEGR